MRYCYFNGKILPFEETKIGINDLGLLRAYAAFDYLRTYNGKPFRWHDHYSRFKNSALELNLPFGYSEHELQQIIEQLLVKSEKVDACIRLILTGGYSEDSMTIAEPNFIIAIEDLPMSNPEMYENGVKLITCEYLRDVPPAKSTGYLNAIKLQPMKLEHNAFDILYTWRGEVLEITRNNFFIFKNNVLITPVDNILHGITRKVVLELAKSNFTIEERRVDVAELQDADEAFLCGTTKKAIPVVEIDAYKIADGKVGDNTKIIMALFDEYVQNY